MNPKLWLFLTWLFYLLERRTSDEIWLICMAYSTVLAACAYFYKKENRGAPPIKEAEEKQ